METIAAGYKAFNGYVFTEADARLYMAECEKADAYPTEGNLNYRHRAFCIIIGLYDEPKQNGADNANAA